MAPRPRPLEAAEAAIAAAAGAPDHAYDPIGARHHAALDRLLRTPAPDLPALARKRDLALEERTVEFTGDEVAMRMLKQDAYRLAASAAELVHAKERRREGAKSQR
jgi:hypothetical protein